MPVFINDKLVRNYNLIVEQDFQNSVDNLARGVFKLGKHVYW